MRILTCAVASEQLRRLAVAEAAARLALDRAMVRATRADELERLRTAWIAANDRLADAIERKRCL